MSITCPKCGCTNRSGATTCALCGLALEELSFEELFGPPKQLQGRYLIRRALSQGYALSLYEASDQLAANQPCLIQEITTSLLDWREREEAEARFLSQAAVWRAVQQPNVARLSDAFVHNRRLYVVTERQEGLSLQDIVQDRRQTPAEATLLHWARQLCDVLDALHNRTPLLVLGYLSPAALQVDPAGDIRLVDFGLWRLAQTRRGGSAAQRGVPGYEAPEQRHGPPTLQSDIYSLGIVLYAAATHHDPTERPLPALRNAAPHLSDVATKIIARAYRRDPARRYATAAEMRQALLTLGEPVLLKVELLPFVLREGQQASTLRDLVRLCSTHWDDGLRALVNGRIEDWLARAAASLRESGQTLQAQEVEAAAWRAVQAREKMAHDASRPGHETIAHHAVFAAWLEEMGALGVQPRLEVQPRGFDFGQIPPNMKAVTHIQIRNKGQGYLSGHVESRFPWLTVPKPLFGCRAGETAEVQIVARGRRLPAGRFGSPQSILVNSNGGQVWLETRAESSQPKLAVESAQLDFGPIARSGAHLAYLTLSNQGGGVLTGQVSSHLPWLRVRRPAFRCPAGASARLAVELLGSQMPPETSSASQVRRALAIDSDSGQATVGIAWTWARPALALDVTTLDFGAIRRGAHVKRSLSLSNAGNADLVGQAISQVDWLAVQPVEFRCPPGETQTLQVTCHTARLPGGDTFAGEALRIQANAGQQALSASVEVLAPELVVEPALLDLGTIHDGDDVEVTVTVGNRGSLPWEGEARSAVPWLNIEPTALLCEPGHFVPLTAVLDIAAFETGGEQRVENALQIAGQGEMRSVAVHVTLARPQLAVARRSIDFGLIGRQDVATLPLEISNIGTGELRWQIEWPTTGQDAWLEVVPASGVCGAGQQVTAQVRAYALAVSGESGQAWLTIHSSAGRADLPASVALSAPRLVIEPLRLNLGDSENYAPLSQTLRIVNRGVGRLQGTVTSRLPWLTCQPQAFDCDSGAAVRVEVQARPEGLREGPHNLAEALLVESNAGQETIAARLTVTLAPRLHLASQSLRFSRQGPAAQTVRLENKGYGTLQVQVIPGDEWITVNRQQWTIKGGRKANLEISVALDAAPSEGTGAVEIRTPDEVLQLAIQIDF